MDFNELRTLIKVESKKGTFVSFSQKDGGATINIKCDAWRDDPLALGESIAVQGVCLTVTSFSDTSFSADVLKETLNCTVLGTLKSGMTVNLERALRLSDRVGGHLVAGHVDGIGTVTDISYAGRDRVIRVKCSEDEFRYIVYKGSVALNGISLTVSKIVNSAEFEVNIIPATWEMTSLSSIRVNDGINIETDIVGRYIERFMKTTENSNDGGLTMEQLLQAGF